VGVISRDPVISISAGMNIGINTCTNKITSKSRVSMSSYALP
jgi:hypothetical protein